jgi:hypothetical protein
MDTAIRMPREFGVSHYAPDDIFVGHSSVITHRNSHSTRSSVKMSIINSGLKGRFQEMKIQTSGILSEILWQRIAKSHEVQQRNQLSREEAAHKGK